MLTLVLSGPPGTLRQATEALKRKGYEVQPPRKADRTFGFPEEEFEYLRCEGPDAEKALATVARLGWRLRAHFTNANRLAISAERAPALSRTEQLEQRLAAIEARLNGAQQ